MTDPVLEHRESLDFEEDRYAALKLIDWFNLERVQKAKFLIIGAGAIGNEVLKNLALLGLGNIFIYDRDKIEMSNLTRSILFRASDCNQLKAKTAARALRDINPDVRVQWRSGDVVTALGLGLIRRMDVIIGCLDNRKARYHINKKCYQAGRPWIDAGIGHLNGHVSVFQPPQGACYECAFAEDDYDQVSLSCNRLASRHAVEGKIPTTPTMASIVAGIQIQEALKLLEYANWQGRTLVGRKFIYDGRVNKVGVINLPRRQDCYAHHTIKPEQIIELPEARAAQTTVGQLLQLVQEHLGAGATLSLNFDLALSVSCKYCHQTKELLSPWDKLFSEDVCCPHCGREGVLDYGTDLINTINESQAHFAMLRDLPLSRIKIPPLDILMGTGADSTTAYFELTGDKQGLLGAFKE